VWFHGASAGDVAALSPLIHVLLARGIPSVLSVQTRSGEQMARKRWGEEVALFRAPLDLAFLVRRVLHRLRPRMLVLECLEMWPHLVRASREAGIPVAVVNGRLSSSSLRRYAWARGLFHPCFSSLSLVVAVTSSDAERFVEAGTPPERVRVESSSKYATLQGAPSDPGNPPTLVFGSLHRREEDLLLPWVPRLLQQDPRVKLVIAPRYPHRARDVVRRLAGLGVLAELSSAVTAVDLPRVFVLDRMGALAEHYRGARAAFIGGSLLPHGGHNLMEAAAQGVPVFFGPYTQHCAEEAKDLLANGAGNLVRDGQEFFHRAFALLHDEASWGRARKACLEVCARWVSGAHRTSHHLLDLLARSPNAGV
jgi:3-deoxy-D-manno-octulosonic-acid transferase